MCWMEWAALFRKIHISKKIWIELLLCAACGIFCALCFDVAALAPFVWVALAPMFFVLLKNRESTKRLLLRAGIFSLALCLFYYAQMMSLDISERAGEGSGAILVLAWLMLSILHGAVFAAALFAGFRFKCPDALRAPLAAVLWAGAEWLLGAGVLGLPLIRLGVTQWQFLNVTQSSALFGVLFIGFLIVLVNVLLAQGFMQRTKKRTWYLCAAALVFFVNFVYGTLVLNTRAPEDAGVSVAAVQMDAPFYQNGGQGRYEKAVALMEEAAKNKPDLILLPENSVYGSFMEEEELYTPAQEAARKADAYVLVGAYGIHGFALRNSMFFVTPAGEIADVYNKQRLVPFFENGYERPFSFIDEGYRGVFETKYGNLGVMICFESLFADISADTIGKGAEALVVATNDSWFTSEVPLRRHLAQSVLRAQETGKYLVQVSNNGMSAVVAPTGEVVSALEANTRGVLYGDISFLKNKTPYLVIGDWWLAAAAGAVVMSVILVQRKRN